MPNQRPNDFESKIKHQKNNHQINLIKIKASFFEKHWLKFLVARWIVILFIIMAVIIIYIRGTDDNVRYYHFTKVFEFLLYTFLGSILESLFNIREKYKKFFKLD